MSRLLSLVACLLLPVVLACDALPPPTPEPTSTPSPIPTVTASPAPAAGPPFPDPIPGEVVYDVAGVLSPATEAVATQIIVTVEELIGAEVAVYTQLKPEATTASTERDAMALMDQWGIGRQGIDDGLVILLNLDETLCHGQVQLYAGPGYRADYLSNSDRQRIIEDDMLPLLRECDIGSALLVALERVEENAREVGPLD